jgi:nickel-dependent lactate racemase
MTIPPKDPLDHILDMMLSDDSPMTAEDEEDAAQAERAVEQAKTRLAKERLDRARAGVMADRGNHNITDLTKARARKLVERARAGDAEARVTLAARFGEGMMNQDMEAAIEDIAELLDDEDDAD